MSDAINYVGDCADVHVEMLRHPSMRLGARIDSTFTAGVMSIWAKIKLANGVVPRTRRFSTLIHTTRNGPSDGILCALKSLSQFCLRPLAAARWLGRFALVFFFLRPLQHLQRLFGIECLLHGKAGATRRCLKSTTRNCVAHVAQGITQVKMFRVDALRYVTRMANVLLARRPNTIRDCERHSMRAKDETSLPAPSIFQTSVSSRTTVSLPKPTIVLVFRLHLTPEFFFDFLQRRIGDCSHIGSAINLVICGHAASRQKGYCQ